MNEAQRDQQHEFWFTQGRNALQQELHVILTRHRRLRISRQILMLLTLEPALWEFFRRTLNNLPSGWMEELYLHLYPSNTDQYCRNPPDDEDLLETVTELARIVRSVAGDSVKRLALTFAPPTIASLFLSTFPRLEALEFRAMTIEVPLIFSIMSIRHLYLTTMTFPTSESIEALCLGMETSSVEVLTMTDVLPSPEHEAQLAAGLARCKTLVAFHCPSGASQSFIDHYCVAISKMYDTKLEWLWLSSGNGSECELDLRGEHGSTTGIEADEGLVWKICHLLDGNRLRRFCPPLFAAIGNAQTDATIKQCLVEALEAVNVPVLFEYITANSNNLIELIQRLGRAKIVSE